MGAQKPCNGPKHACLVKCFVGKHTVYFTKEDGFILVVAILGQSQLPENHLSFYL